MNRIDRIPETAYVVKFLEDKDEQFRNKLESIKIPKTCHDGEIRCQAEVMNLIDDSKEYLRPLVVMSAFDRGAITEGEAVECLRYVYEKGVTEKMSMTNMKCAVSYIGYKKFKSGRDSQMDCKNPELRVCAGQNK